MAKAVQSARTVAESGTGTFVKDMRFERWRWQAFAITWLAYAGYYFTRQALAAAKVGILDDPTVNHTLTKGALGAFDSVYLIAYAVGQFLWGTLADRYGPRVVVIGGMLGSIAAATVMGLFPALLIFGFAQAVQGLSQSTGWSSLTKNISSFFTVRERGRIMGIWATNYAFGGLVAPPVAGWFAYSVFHTWRAAFLSMAVLLAAVLVLFVLFQRNRPQDVGLPDIETYKGSVLTDVAEQDRAAPPPEEKTDTLQALRTAMRNKVVVTLGLSYFLLKPARYAILLWGPVIVKDRLPHTGNLEAVIIPFAFGAAGLAAPILAGWISDRLFQSRRMPICVLSLLALTAVMAVFTPLTSTHSVVLMVVVLAAIGVTVYMADAMISGVAAVDFGTTKAAGTSAGFINGMGSVGAVFGGLLPALIDGEVLFYLFAGAALISGLVLAPHWNRMPASE